MKTKKTNPTKVQFVPENDRKAARWGLAWSTASIGNFQIAVDGDQVEISPGDTVGFHMAGTEGFLLSQDFRFLVTCYQALYLKHVEELRELVAGANDTRKMKGKVAFYQYWLAAAIDRISEKVADPSVQRRYLDSDNPKFKLLYLDYVETAAAFAESALMAFRFLSEGDALGAAARAFSAGQAAAALDADRLERRTQRAALERKLPSVERAAVKQLDSDLQAEITKKTPRYRAISERLEIPAGRVRYIIEGPRRKKK